MTNERVTVVARIRARAGHEEEVKRALLALIPPTLAEEGCLNYDLHRSLDDPTLFLFHENWTSREALDRHLKMPHLSEFGGRTAGLLAEPVEITVWESVAAEGQRE